MDAVALAHRARLLRQVECAACYIGGEQVEGAVAIRVHRGRRAGLVDGVGHRVEPAEQGEPIVHALLRLAKAQVADVEVGRRRVATHHERMR